MLVLLLEPPDHLLNLHQLIGEVLLVLHQRHRASLILHL